MSEESLVRLVEVVSDWRFSDEFVGQLVRQRVGVLRRLLGVGDESLRAAVEAVTPDGARYAAHLIRKRSRGDRFHPRRPETAAAMLAAAEWLDQFASATPSPPIRGDEDEAGERSRPVLAAFEAHPEMFTTGEPCAREHRPGWVCIRPNGHTPTPSDTEDATPTEQGEGGVR